MAKSPCSPDAQSATGLLHHVREGHSVNAPLIFLVHGRAGTRDVMWTFERTLPSNCWILAPQAPQEDPQGGFSWWPMEAGTRDPDLVRAAITELGSFFESSERYYGLTPTTRIGIGFSQGAALLSGLAHSAFGETLTGIGLLAGFVLEDNEKALATKNVFVGHGLKDEVVSIAKAHRGIEYLKKRGALVTSAFDEVAHKVGTNATREMKGWVSKLCGP